MTIIVQQKQDGSLVEVKSLDDLSNGQVKVYNFPKFYDLEDNILYMIEKITDTASFISFVNEFVKLQSLNNLNELDCFAVVVWTKRIGVRAKIEFFSTL